MEKVKLLSHLTEPEIPPHDIKSLDGPGLIREFIRVQKLYDGLVSRTRTMIYELGQGQENPHPDLIESVTKINTMAESIRAYDDEIIKELGKRQISDLEKLKEIITQAHTEINY